MRLPCRNAADNPLWSGLNGVLPYLLLLLGPLLGLLLIVSLGPFLFNKVMAFIKQQIDAIKMQLIQVHYHRLEMADREAHSSCESMTMPEMANSESQKPCYLGALDWIARDGQLELTHIANHHLRQEQGLMLPCYSNDGFR
uniref:Uncharacterized protein n=1 Tax=Molossus molossus TaxID=27622 RepID=A0A7J8J7Q4_MOLMO|nr:hypothetical protein HJG59_009590 [Molossus molossus]